jgi:hypothetical protein
LLFAHLQAHNQLLQQRMLRSRVATGKDFAHLSQYHLSGIWVL